MRRDHLLSAALAYATTHQFSVIPANYPVLTRDGGIVCSCGRQHGVGKNGKHPAIGWKYWQFHQPAESVVRDWFSGRFAGYNIAMLHGANAGTCLLDWDGLEGFASQRQLERELGPLPDTPTVLSGGGGSHQIFRHPGRHVPTVKAVREGFDIRGDGGISILPPSAHEQRQDYAWDCDADIDDLPVAALPAAWIDFICAASSNMVVSSNQSVETQNVQWQPAADGAMIVHDGREIFMRDTVWRVLDQLTIDLGQRPGLQQLYDAACASYLPHIDHSRPGRGADEVLVKCRAALKSSKAAVTPRGLSKPFLKNRF